MPTPFAMGSVMWKILQTTSPAGCCDAGEDDDGTRQGRDAAQLSGNVHADGRGDGLRQEGGVLLPGEAQREGQSQSAAQAHQRTH